MLAASGSEAVWWREGKHHQPFSSAFFSSVLFLPQNFSTFKLTGAKEGQVVGEAVCGIAKPCSSLSVCLFLFLPFFVLPT